MYDVPRATAQLARQAPWWEPGTASGYHAMSQGHLVGELVRRVSGRTLTQFVAEEIAGPLGADFTIGVPPSERDRVAPLVTPPRVPVDWDALDPADPYTRTIDGPRLSPAIANTTGWQDAEIGAGNGHGNARSVARMLSAVSLGGTVDGVRLLSPETVDLVFEEQSNGVDLVLGVPLRFGVGFGLSQPETVPDLPPGRTCFWCGWGGSMVVMDVDRRTTFSYTMNRMSTDLIGSQRGWGYLRAAYRARALSQHDQLAAEPGTDVVHGPAVLHEVGLHLVPLPEAQRRLRGQRRAVAGEEERLPDGHERPVEVDHVQPGLHDADAGHGGPAPGVLPGPVLPLPTGRTPRLEGEVAGRTDGLVHAPQGRRPVVRVDDRLGDVAGHHREVHLQRRQRRGRAAQPPHPLRTGLGLRHLQHPGGRVDRRHGDAAGSEQQRERPRPAAQVQHRTSAQLVDQRRVRLEVTTVRVERVVDRREARPLVRLVSHGVMVPGPASGGPACAGAPAPVRAGAPRAAPAGSRAVRTAGGCPRSPHR